MFKNIVPMLVVAGKFTGRVVSTTLVAMGTVKTTEYVADRLQRWNHKRQEKKASRPSPQAAQQAA